jgi:beta-1,4-mannosyl-glycoprotein beta-1,4-N-acetylglucosaminyltransferase
MTVWSACMFSFELDVLEIRLTALDPVVDRHVIAESTLTHAGHPKPLVFAENRDRFAEWDGKIIHVIQDDPPQGDWAPADAQPFAESASDHWGREHAQRDALSAALAAAADDDLILLSDCDEIPDPARAWNEGRELAEAGAIACPILAMHVGRPRWRWPHAVPGTRTRLLTGRTLRQYGGSVDDATVAPNLIYGSDGAAGVGWHLAYMGGIDAIRQKLAWFAHQELNRPPYNDSGHIAQCLETGADLFNRPDRQSIECPAGELPPRAGLLW